MNILKNKGVQGAIVALVLAIAAALGLQGCAGQRVTPKVAAALEVLDCQLDAVKALVPSVAVAEEVVIAARAGNYPYATGLLLQLGLSIDEAGKVADAFAACTPSKDVPDEPTLPTLTQG